MAYVKIILSLCFLFLQLTLVIAQVEWENCDSDSNDIKLLNLTIKPYPIVLPGSISIEITVHNTQDVASPVTAELKLYKKVLFSHVHVPCISGIGSCKYDDLCTIYPKCGCPLKAGDHVLTLPITIDTSSWALVGSYQGQVNIETKSGQKGCVKVSSVRIQSSN